MSSLNALAVESLLTKFGADQHRAMVDLDAACTRLRYRVAWVVFHMTDPSGSLTDFLDGALMVAAASKCEPARAHITEHVIRGSFAGGSHDT